MSGRSMVIWIILVALLFLLLSLTPAIGSLGSRASPGMATPPARLTAS